MAYEHRLFDHQNCDNDPCDYHIAKGQPAEFCDHDSRHLDTVTTNYMTADGVGEYETEVYVCDDCGEVIDPDVAAPALDRQEAEAEYYAD